ncbi:DNA ligase [Vibrio sp. 10N.261.51.F12]
MFLPNYRYPLSFPASALSLAMLSTSALSESTTNLTTHNGKAPAVVNAINYHHTINVQDYFVSEKLDGIRAIWTGQQLISRSGRELHAPDWFIAVLPDFPVEGELWAGRGQFALVQRTVLDAEPNHEAWRQIHFMLFDSPDHIGAFEERYQFLTSLCQNLSVKHVKCVEQTDIESHESLQHLLETVSRAGGEGLMLKSRMSVYLAGRNTSLLKMKTNQDSEATVVGYKAGKGKYKGKMGAVLVELKGGTQFYIGTGFSDRERNDPPKLGDIVTFKHNGWTENGIPRFARYQRIRLPE